MLLQSNDCKGEGVKEKQMWRPILFLKQLAAERLVALLRPQGQHNPGRSPERQKQRWSCSAQEEGVWVALREAHTSYGSASCKPLPGCKRLPQGEGETSKGQLR